MFRRTSLLVISVGALVGMASQGRAQPPTSHEVWLSCKWHETWYSFGFLGRASSEDKSEHDFSKTYVYVSGQNALREYFSSAQQLQFVDGATVDTGDVYIETKDHYDDPGLGGHSQSQRTWTLNRKTLQVSSIFSSSQDLMMGDGRMSSLRMNGAGSGSCTLIDPLPIAPEQPNKF